MTKARTEGQKKRGRPSFGDVPRQPNGKPSRMSKAKIEDNQSVALLARARHAQTAEALHVEMDAAMRALGGDEGRAARAKAVRDAVDRQQAALAKMANPMPVRLPVELDMSEPDPKKRERKFAKVRHAADMQYQSDLARWRETMRDPRNGCAAGRAIIGQPDEDDLWDAISRMRAVYRAYWSLSGIPAPYAKGMSMEVMPESLGSDGVEASGGGSLLTPEERAMAATASVMRIEGALMSVGAVQAVKRPVLSMGPDDAVQDRVRFLAGLRAVVALVKGK